MKLAKDGKLAIPEATVQETCIELAKSMGYLWIKTNASDLMRSGFPSHSTYTLDGVFVHPWRRAVIVEWKARMARTANERRFGQRRRAEELVAQGFLVIRMEDGLDDPIGWFRERFKKETCRG